MIAVRYNLDNADKPRARAPTSLTFRFLHHLTAREASAYQDFVGSRSTSATQILSPREAGGVPGTRG